MPRPSWAVAPASGTVSLITTSDDICGSARADVVVAGEYLRTHPQSYVRVMTDATALTCSVYTTEVAATARLAAYCPDTDTWTSATPSSTGRTDVTLSLPGTGTREVWVVNFYERLDSGTGGGFGCWLRTAVPDDGSTFSRLQFEHGRQSIVSMGMGGAGLITWTSAEIVRNARAAFYARGLAASTFKILLQVSRNDWASGVTVAAHGTRLSGVIDALLAENAAWTVYCQTPIPQSSETGGGGVTLTQYRTEIASVVSGKASERVVLVDGTAVLTTGDLTDGVHLDDDGHVAYADQLIDALGLDTGSGCTLLVHDSHMVQTASGAPQSKNTVTLMRLGAYT